MSDPATAWEALLIGLMADIARYVQPHKSGGITWDGYYAEIWAQSDTERIELKIKLEDLPDE